MAGPHDRLRTAPRERRCGAPPGSRTNAHGPHQPAGRGPRSVGAGALRDPDSRRSRRKEVAMKQFIALLLALGALSGRSWALDPATTLPLSRLGLPPGFEIELFARVPNARQMTLGK